MVIFGSGGLSKQAIGILEKDLSDDPIFFDDVHLDKDLFLGKYAIIHTYEEIKEHFNYDDRFVLSIGNIPSKSLIYSKLISLGGRPFSLIDDKTSISPYSILSDGLIVLAGAVIEPNVTIGYSSIINLNTIIAHDVKIGNFCEVGPGAILLGSCELADHVFIGANATILPKIKIGKNVIIGASTLVNKDIPDNKKAVGVPCKIY